MLYLIFFRGLPRTGRTEPTESKSRTDHPFGRNMFLFWALVNYYSRHVYILARARTDVHTAQGTQTHANPNKQSHINTQTIARKHAGTQTNINLQSQTHASQHSHTNTYIQTCTHAQTLTQTHKYKPKQSRYQGTRTCCLEAFKLDFPSEMRLFLSAREGQDAVLYLIKIQPRSQREKHGRMHVWNIYFSGIKKSYFCEIDSFYLIYI